MKSNKLGFTLIELLVVVLIIGILAAIALAQYRTVVDKSKAAQALATIKTVYAAQERHKLATGSYANKFEELDIEIPNAEVADCGDKGSECVKKGDYLYRLRGPDSNLVQVRILRNDTWVLTFQTYGNHVTCIARPEERYRRLCRALGGVERTDTPDYFDM
jgi:prepilin-type N-terminal cleavage/methylation domain-containing protein